MPVLGRLRDLTGSGGGAAVAGVVGQDSPSTVVSQVLHSGGHKFYCLR